MNGLDSRTELVAFGTFVQVLPSGPACHCKLKGAVPVGVVLISTFCPE